MISQTEFHYETVATTGHIYDGLTLKHQKFNTEQKHHGSVTVLN